MKLGCDKRWIICSYYIRKPWHTEVMTRQQVNQMLQPGTKPCSTVFQVRAFLSRPGPPREIKVNSIYMLLALEFVGFFFLVCCCKTEFHYVTQAILKLTNLSASTSLCSLGWPQILRPFCFSLPEHWDHRRTSPRPVHLSFLMACDEEARHESSVTVVGFKSWNHTQCWHALFVFMRKPCQIGQRGKKSKRPRYDESL